ncbi:protein BatD [Stutzerimonas kirkiae]|uniref:Protein BatD n=1 Tax=Stutzerimonas kirkiae TaxID=2211392 RepID=A0A4Q9QZC6_9GAMM|nr:BatD family protein [Stutzerimonas kirkiae]TBU91279.1 protein BatD [Stutzerimonas kirkiae]TBV00451.1 protein BatD [Stutzerimonas kirkiae]TBV15257.1 protein BatD [Stutzerimonas kirkiae]
MTRRIVLMLGLLAISLQLQASGLVASVDRSRLSLDETFELTLESMDATLFGKPDLQPLDDSFKVLATRQFNQLANVNGENRAVTRWLVTLQPRYSGHVLVPPLSLGEWRSEPIELQVQQASDSVKSGQLAPIFIDASLDQESVYVQAQAILTLRIYHSVSLYDDSTLSPLQAPDMLVERLGEPRTYEKLINGIRHGVIEVRYALYAQKSGELLIPGQLFSATPVSQGTGISPFGQRPGAATQVSAPAIPLQVRPKPAGYPPDQPWLPARSLELSETWSGPAQGMRQGESLTRTLVLKAQGLVASQLPPIPATESHVLRVYPEQPGLSSETFEHGVTATREQREALVAVNAGSAELPAIDIAWWNTREDRLEHAHLAARTLEIEENPALLRSERPSAASDATLAQATLWPWQLSSGLLACSTLLGFGLWLRARRQPPILRQQQSGPTPRSLLDDLKKACQGNDTQATRQALDAWARQQPETLAEMAARFVPLSQALDALNSALYSETGRRWHGEALWQAIQHLPPAQEPISVQENSSLPPLYPR